MKNFICLFIVLFSYSAFAGGPWLNKKKTGFFQLQSTFPGGSYNTLFIENGKESVLKNTVLDYTFQAYLEYGITNKFNVIATLPYKLVSTQQLNDSLALDDGSLSGLSNFKLGFKYQLIDKKIKLAVSLQSSLNTTSANLNKGLATGYQANTFGVYAHIGTGFSAKLYSFLDFGANKMSNNYSDFIDFHYEIGYQVKPSFWLAFTLDLRESLKTGTANDLRLNQTGLYTNNQEYFAYGLKASYELKNKIGFTAATFGAFSGNYVAKVATFSLGIYKKW